MKLSELTNKIVKPNGLWTQTVAEEKTGIPQWKLSNFKLATDDSDYEKAWQDFLKLLAFCQQHDIDPAGDPAQELKSVVIEEMGARYVEKAAREITGGTNPRGKRRRKKKAPGGLSSSGTEGY
jgi:hypothetical protein